MLCAKFDWNCPSGSGEEVENVKSLQTDGQTIRTAHLSFKLKWAKIIFAQVLAYKFREVLNLVHCSIIIVNVCFALEHSALGTTGIFNYVYKDNLY